MRSLLTTLFFMCSAQCVMACSLEEVFNWNDRPIEVASDGSFKYAENTPYIQHFGDEIVDLGAQRVAQRLSQTTSCGGLREQLLFADCRTGEVVFIPGLEDPDYPGGDYVLIDLIQVPIGPIDVRNITSIEELVSIAFGNGYEVYIGLGRGPAMEDRHNRYDPFNGCKIYYPDTRGAGL